VEVQVSRAQGTWFQGHRVHGFELGAQGTWAERYRVPGFMSTGYIVSRVAGCRAWGCIVSHYPQ